MQKTTLLISILIVCPFLFAFSQTRLKATDPKLPEVVNVPFVSAVDGNTCWAIGTPGTYSGQVWEFDDSHSFILRTSNGGGFWNVQSFGADNQLMGSLSAKSFKQAWLVTYDININRPRVWRTKRGGYIWQSLDPGITENSFYDVIHMWNPFKGVIIGDPVDGRFEIFTTNSGGDFWTKAADAPMSEAGEYGNIGQFYTQGKSIYMPTSKGRIVFSNNLGENWQIVKTPFSSLDFCAFKNNDVGVAVANDYSNYPFTSQISTTTDGGRTWSTPVSQNYGFFKVAYIPTTNSLVGTTRERNDIGPFSIVASFDDGKTWQTAETGTPMATFDFTAEGIGYGGKFKNDDSPTLMYRSERPSNALEAMIAPSNSLVLKPEKAFYTHVYPNIITDKMTIEYNLPYETALTFQVFDMSGREVAVQKQQNTEGGIVQLQAASWAKGLYIVKITTDKGETQQHKLFKK